MKSKIMLKLYIKFYYSKTNLIKKKKKGKGNENEKQNYVELKTFSN